MNDDEILPIELVDSGHVEEAVEAFRAAGLLEETTLEKIGHQLLGHSRPEEAVTVFRKNVELYPEHANPLNSLADALMSVGDFDGAERVLRTLLERLESTSESDTTFLTSWSRSSACRIRIRLAVIMA